MLTVSCDGVVRWVGRDRLGDLNVEKRTRRAGLKGTVDRDWHAHQLAICRNVKQLFPIAAPLGLHPTGQRDRELCVSCRVRSYINLERPGLVGGVRDPAHVWRESRLDFVEWRDEKRFCNDARSERH